MPRSRDFGKAGCRQFGSKQKVTKSSLDKASSSADSNSSPPDTPKASHSPRSWNRFSHCREAGPSTDRSRPWHRCLTLFSILLAGLSRLAPALSSSIAPSPPIAKPLLTPMLNLGVWLTSVCYRGQDFSSSALFWRARPCVIHGDLRTRFHPSVSISIGAFLFC